MPYKFENKHLKMKKEDDKRVKLVEDDKEEIRELYKQGILSQRKLAEMFNVSRRTIQFVLNPEKLEENYRKRVERGKDGRYYDKEKQKEYMRQYRREKKQLYDKGELI